MKDYIRKRVLDICEHMIETKQTVRQTATVFGVSKSTVHKDIPKVNDTHPPSMSLHITFVNPNSSEEADKYLPKILAEAVLNRIAREMADPDVSREQGYNIKHYI